MGVIWYIWNIKPDHALPWQANLVAAQMYDAVFLYAKAVEEAVNQGMSIEDGAGLVKLMSSMKWIGELALKHLGLMAVSFI